MKNILGKLAIGTALVGALAGCKTEQTEQQKENLHMTGIVRNVGVNPQYNSLDLKIDVPREWVRGHGARFREDTINVNLLVEPDVFITGYSISIGDTVTFVLTDGFKKITEFEQTGIYSGINKTHYEMNYRPTKGAIILSYRKGSNK